MPGPEEIPELGWQAADRAAGNRDAGGADGCIKFNRATHPIRIEGKQDIGSAPNNVLSVRMRVPSESAAAGRSQEGLLAARRAFTPPSCSRAAARTFSVNLPEARRGLPGARRKVPDLLRQPGQQGRVQGRGVGQLHLDPLEPRRPATSRSSPSASAGSTRPRTPTRAATTPTSPTAGSTTSRTTVPKLYNPDQADGNNDGVGDACEDYDGDNKLNVLRQLPHHDQHLAA